MDECEAMKMAGEAVQTLATQAGREFAKGAFRKLVDFLKGRFGNDVAEKVDAVAQDGTDDRVAEALRGSICAALLRSPEFLPELRQILDAASTRYGPQEANVDGSGSVIQIQGNENKIG